MLEKNPVRNLVPRQFMKTIVRPLLMPAGVGKKRTVRGTGSFFVG
jgi:hypothetical protein